MPFSRVQQAERCNMIRPLTTYAIWVTVQRLPLHPARPINATLCGKYVAPSVLPGQATAQKHLQVTPSACPSSLRTGKGTTCAIRVRECTSRSLAATLLHRLHSACDLGFQTTVLSLSSRSTNQSFSCVTTDIICISAITRTRVGADALVFRLFVRMQLSRSMHQTFSAPARVR